MSVITATTARHYSSFAFLDFRGFFAGGCTGTPISSLSLAPAAQRNDVTVLPPVKLEPRTGAPQDLCFRFTQSGVDPMWAIRWIEVRP